MLTTVLFDLTIVIAAGMLFFIAIFVIHISNLQISVVLFVSIDIFDDSMEIQSATDLSVSIATIDIVL